MDMIRSIYNRWVMLTIQLLDPKVQPPTRKSMHVIEEKQVYKKLKNQEERNASTSSRYIM